MRSSSAERARAVNHQRHCRVEAALSVASLLRSKRALPLRSAIRHVLATFRPPAAAQTADEV
jgi:hypothetical protein